MFTLSCESTVDLNLQYLTKRNIPVISYTYTVDGVEYEDDMRAGNGLAIFYNQLAAGKMPSTSLINVERYKQFFRSLLTSGDVLHVAFSGGLSQSANNAKLAAEQLQREFPDRKVLVVDSLCACVGYGMFVDSVADVRDSGKSLDEAYAWAMDNRLNVHHQFFPTTLTYFRRSGRVSGLKAFVGNIFKLCPIMRVDSCGKLIAYSKVMSESKAITKTLQEVEAKILDGQDYNGKLWVGHSDYISCANKIVTELKAKYPKADVRIYDIGPVIASHCGPGTLAVFFWGRSPRGK